jgi:hypothetical protein
MASILKVDEVQPVTSGGGVRLSQNPLFSVSKSSAQSIGTSYTQVTYDTENIDVGSDFSGNQFTAPIAGVYVFHLMFSVNGTSNDDELRFEIRKNGSAVTNYFHQVNADNVGADDYNIYYSKFISLAANDVITVFAKAESDTSWSIYGDASYEPTYFEGMLLG